MSSCKLVIKDENTEIVLESNLDMKLNIGYIYLDSRVWPIKMRSCFQTPCNNNSNILNATLNYQ